MGKTVCASSSVKPGNMIVPRSLANRIKNMLQCRRRNTESNRTVLWADLNDRVVIIVTNEKKRGFDIPKKILLNQNR